MKYLTIFFAIVLIGLFGHLQSSKPVYGYWDSVLVNHNGFTVNTTAVCKYSDGSTQTQKTLGFDDKTITFPDCTN